MVRSKELYIGVVEAGIRHASADEPSSIDEKFRMVQEAGVYDYIDATPLPDQLVEFETCSAKYGIPILAGGGPYTLGRDEAKFEQNLRVGARLGSLVHNTALFMDHADGHLISNDAVMRFYLDAYELGERLGCRPTFEVHVNMWSENFTRVLDVARMVHAHGVPFRLTLDHSHVIFKGANNQIEQAVFNIREQIDSGDLILDPFEAGNVTDLWIEHGLVCHVHARSAAPNNPKNIWAQHPDINNLRSSLHPPMTVGRGIQYPFVEPAPGQWHSDWVASDLDAWKLVMKNVLRKHAITPDSELKTISTEFIPYTDYGEGSTYSLFENNTACANWIRSEWEKAISTPL